MGECDAAGGDHRSRADRAIVGDRVRAHRMGRRALRFRARSSRARERCDRGGLGGSRRPRLARRSVRGRRARCLVAHPVNPPHLVPLVELVGAPWTAADTISRAREVYDRIGQVPIVVRREIDGFILNRLQGALIAEAFRLVGEGYVSPQDLDKTVKDGLGLRWSFLGPFETIELNAPGGIADYCARYAGFYQRLLAAPAGPGVFAPENIERMLAQWSKDAGRERLEARSRWRDRRLAALRAHKREQPKDERS